GSKVSYQRKVLLKYRVRRDSISGDSVQRIQREIDAYQRISNLVNLNENQQKIMNDRVERLKIDIEVERGKIFLLKEDFENARKSFSKANEYRHSNRLSWIILMLRFAPRLFLKIYQNRRSGEIRFIPTEVK
nr:hypothetical protein [Pyrinomonadaceae bacterium]